MTQVDKISRDDLRALHDGETRTFQLPSAAAVESGKTSAYISIDAVYSQAEAARLLKVDRHTLRRWEKDPVFPLEGWTRRGGRGKFYRGRQLLAQWTVR